MRLSIGKKLFSSGLVVLLLIILMIVASQIVAGLFKGTSDKLVVEYNELNAVEEFKLSLSSLLFSPTSYALYGNHNEEKYFNILIHNSREKLEECEHVLTESHDLKLLKKFNQLLTNVERLGVQLFSLNYYEENDEVLKIVVDINSLINKGIIDVDGLLSETKNEIEEYIQLNNTVIRHSSITILSLGLIIALIILLGGWVIIRGLTKPIHELVSITEKISKGDRQVKVNINTKDEFNTLADSFNKMLENLNSTTVSKDYLNNILENMFDALIVTDDNMLIQSVNNAAIKMLGHNELTIIGQHISVLFNSQLKITGEKGNLLNYINKLNKTEYLVSKNGQKIPAIISCAELKNQNGLTQGLIMVCHDLTEKKMIEEKLERSRKDRSIDINEAQEEEKIRIATDLHDGLGQMLTAISYSIQELMPKEPEADPVAAHLRIHEQIDKAIKETKNLAHNLIPIVLKDFGLIVAIEDLIARANEIYDIKFRFDAFDFNERIDPKREKVIYRICQESLNNIVKHAHAKNAFYQIFWQDCSVVLVIEDDGIGFNNDSGKTSNQGIGLIGMKERVNAFDGELTINSTPGEGTEIIVDIPCPKLKT